MDIIFWGVRGSIPAPLSPQRIQEKIVYALCGAAEVDLSDHRAVEDYVVRLPFDQRSTFGGNTACLEVCVDDERLILDAGSGIRKLGLKLMSTTPMGQGQGVAHILLSHTHWDHIMGFPFFAPAYIPGNTVIFYGCHEHLEERLQTQQRATHFPVELHKMSAECRFVQWEAGQRYSIGSFTVLPFKQFHPGVSYGYRVEAEGTSLVYATDAEYPHYQRPDYMAESLQSLRRADVLIFDAQYSLRETIEKKEWGHSSPLVGVDIAQKAEVKKLVLFHHDPEADDKAVQRSLDMAIQYQRQTASTSDLEILTAYEGLKIHL